MGLDGVGSLTARAILGRFEGCLVDSLVPDLGRQDQRLVRYRAV